jgi:HSP20 family protein
MALARWTPMRNLQSFQDEMNRLFNQFGRGGTGEETSWGVSTWMPPVDLYETPDAFVLKAELPGLPQDHIQIEVHDRTLTLRGERTPEAGMNEEHYRRRERAYGPFQRSFMLPTMVDQEHVQATYKDGILELHLPKSEAAKPRRIAIQS